jgi:hypothetical protein
MRRTAGWILCTVVVATLLAACSQQTHGASAANDLGSASAGSVGGGAAALPPATGAPEPVKGAASGGSATGTGFDATNLPLGGASVIRTADLTVATTDVGMKADRARRIATDVGGSVDGDDRTSGTHATATMTLRVPPASLSDVLTNLAALGKEQSRHQTSRDVTTEVADVDSRVRSAAAAIAQLRDLYNKATRVSDIIAIETELAQRESDLESLQSQQRALAGQVGMATVTLYLITPPVAVRHHSTHKGFVGGLLSGWHGFTRGATVLVTGIGAALPFLFVLAAVGSVWLVVRRRRGSGMPPAPSPSASPEPAS